MPLRAVWQTFAGLKLDSRNMNERQIRTGRLRVPEDFGCPPRTRTRTLLVTRYQRMTFASILTNKHRYTTSAKSKGPSTLSMCGYRCFKQKLGTIRASAATLQNMQRDPPHFVTGGVFRLDS